MLTKTTLLLMIERECLVHYEWARRDAGKLARLLGRVRRTLTTEKASWHPEGAVMTAVWAELAGRYPDLPPRPTVRYLRRLPD
jgi:hypothetical protein